MHSSVMVAPFIDLRTRILKPSNREKGRQEQITRRFCVSCGMVNKLLHRTPAGFFWSSLNCTYRVA